MQTDTASCTAGPGNGPLPELAQATAGMRVSLTEAAARHITRYLSRRGKGVGVRLGVKTTGCSGLAYKIEFADEVAPEDVVFEPQRHAQQQYEQPQDESDGDAGADEPVLLPDDRENEVRVRLR